MLASERHEIILDAVARQPAVSIRDLTVRLGVSRETVRSDIEALARANKLTQVRGGATQIRTAEPSVETRTATNPTGKALIADHVVAGIPDGASIIIDNGSSTLAIARKLAVSRQNLTICTNDLKIAEILGSCAKEITLLGGRFDRNENATFGLEAMEHLARYRMEFAIISAGGISAHALFTDFSREAADLRHQMMMQSETPLVLADSSKFGTVGQVVMKSLPEQANVVMDQPPPDDIARALKNHGVQYEIST
jgi:DeoR family glycerol-3-phosphate regulon repressor